MKKQKWRSMRLGRLCVDLAHGMVIVGWRNASDETIAVCVLSLPRVMP